MHFTLRGPIMGATAIAVGSRIRELARLERLYGAGRWRKCKGIATVQLPDGSLRVAEIHWYEADGIGRKELKIKRFLNPT